MGVGMIALVDPSSADAALKRLTARGVDAWIAGAARSRGKGEEGDAVAKGRRGGAVSLLGSYRGQR